MLPYDIQQPNSFILATTLAAGIPSLPAAPSLGNGIIDLPLDVGFEGQPKNMHRGYIQSWNLTFKKNWAGLHSTSRTQTP
jgi:hypothetical protein